MKIFSKLIVIRHKWLNPFFFIENRKMYRLTHKKKHMIPLKSGFDLEISEMSSPRQIKRSSQKAFFETKQVLFKIFFCMISNSR